MFNDNLTDVRMFWGEGPPSRSRYGGQGVGKCRVGEVGSEECEAEEESRRQNPELRSTEEWGGAVRSCEDL